MSFRLIDLRCEYAANPLGIDVPRPRLSWRLEGDAPGLRQSAYRVRVGTEPGGADLWDSGLVESAQIVGIEYAGAPVSSSTRAYWTAWAQSTAGEETTSDGAWWETGLLAPEDWRAGWIQAPWTGGPRSTAPAPYLRRQFTIQGPIARARLYIGALGLYEARLNGERVGDQELAPGWTDYKKRVRYQTYDVTDRLVEGENCLGAILGDGWYCGHIAWQDRQRYGDRPKLIAQLAVWRPDGTTSVIATDGDWKAGFGAILESDLLMGEAQDLRREPLGWDRAGFDDSSWPAAQAADEGVRLEAQNSPPMRATEEIRPVSVEGRPGGVRRRWIFDLGQNMVGRYRLRVRGEAGQTLIVRVAERLDERGELYTANYRGARSTDAFTLRGEGEETLEPKFTFHGFQYLEVAGLPEQPALDSLLGVVLRSDLPVTGEFECSEPLLNRLQSNILWGWKGNSLDVPTDCPQRDERLGWTGDAQVFVRTAAFNTLCPTFFEKYEQDLADGQAEDGAIPAVAPHSGASANDGGPAWSDAVVICPWTIYRSFGDRRILERFYPTMVRWMEQQVRTSQDGVRCYEGYEGFRGFGDWLSINAETPNELIGTAYFAYSAGLLAQIARVLGKAEDAARFEAVRETAKGAFQRRYLTPGGLVVSRTQTAAVLALHFDLAPPELRPAIADELVADIARRGWKLSTGFVGSSYLPHALASAGRVDVAYRLLEQRAWPSWLYAVTQGATTIWERWDGWTHDKGFQDPGMNSFNHYAYGAIGEWLYAVVAGIDLAAPGYERIRFRPRPGGSLTWARSALDSLYGRIESEWRLEEDKFDWRLRVPPNTSATAELPPEAVEATIDGRRFSGETDLEPGEYRVQAAWSAARD